MLDFGSSVDAETILFRCEINPHERILIFPSLVSDEPSPPEYATSSKNTISRAAAEHLQATLQSNTELSYDELLAKAVEPHASAFASVQPKFDKKYFDYMPADDETALLGSGGAVQLFDSDDVEFEPLQSDTGADAGQPIRLMEPVPVLDEADIVAINHLPDRRRRRRRDLYSDHLRGESVDIR